NVRDKSSGEESGKRWEDCPDCRHGVHEKAARRARATVFAQTQTDLRGSNRLPALRGDLRNGIGVSVRISRTTSKGVKPLLLIDPISTMHPCLYRLAGSDPATVSTWRVCSAAR